MRNRPIALSKLANFFPDVVEMLPTDAILERKAITTGVEEVNDDAADVIVTGVFSTEIVDHDGDIVVADGVSTDYFNGATIWNHNLSQPPVGLCFDISTAGNRVTGKVRMAKDYEVAEDLTKLLKQGILRSFSMGFVPKRILVAGTAAFSAYATAKGLNVTGCKRIIAECYLVEMSLCTVGANRNALVQAITSKSLTLGDSVGQAMELDSDYLELAQRLADLEQKMLDMVQLKAVDTVVLAEVEKPEPKVEVEVEVEVAVEPVVAETPAEAVVEPTPAPTPVEAEEVTPSEAPVKPFDFSGVKAVVVKLPQPDPERIKTIAKSLRMGRLV